MNEINGNEVRNILISLNSIIGDDKIKKFFKNLSNASVTKKTIDNIFNQDYVFSISQKTQNFLSPYIESPQSEPDFFEILKDNKEKLGLKNFEGAWFTPFLESSAENEIENGNFIGKLQDKDLPFHKQDHKNNDTSFWGILYKKTKMHIKRGLQTVSNNNGGNKFLLSFIKISTDAKAAYTISCQLGTLAIPSETDTIFAKRVKEFNPKAHDGVSFGLSTYEVNEADKRVDITLQYQRYLSSLEQHDAFYMEAIFYFGKKNQDIKFNHLLARVGRIRENKNSSFPILGVTTAVLFKRQDDDKYWTFIQLKEGGASRIPESHLTPSFVHQLVTKTNVDEQAQAQDIEFHIYRELIEEIFNYEEDRSNDYRTYRRIVYKHPAIQSILALKEQGKAELFCHGLVLDAHRAKYELVYVLRIDDPSWMETHQEHIKENHEAIKDGVIPVPLTEDYVFKILEGSSIKHDDAVVRRMCAPGQAGLVAAIKHLQAQGYPYLKDVVIADDDD